MSSKAGGSAAAPTAVVADANVLLSAVVGKAALRVFAVYRVEAHVAEYNLDEVRQYLDVMAKRYRLPAAVLQAQLRLLGLRTHVAADYERAMARVPAALHDRDPDDVHAVALALSLGLPIWSNDSDLKVAGVAMYTTAGLLRLLERGRD